MKGKIFALIALMLLVVNTASALTATLNLPPAAKNGFYKGDIPVSVITDTGPVSVNITFEGTLVADTQQRSPTNYTANISVSGLEGEAFLINISAWNSSDNQSTTVTDSASVKIDDLPPDIDYSGTKTNVTKAKLDQKVKISILVDDQFPDYATVGKTGYKTNVTLTDGAGQIIKTPSEMGCQDNTNCSIDLAVYDKAGNSDTGFLILEVSSSSQQLPASAVNITIHSPGNNSFWPDSMIPVAFTASTSDAPDSDTVFCRYRLVNLDTLAVPKSKDYFTDDFTGAGNKYEREDIIYEVRDGNYKLEITCLDDQQIEFSKASNIVVLDTTEPIVIIDVKTTNTTANITLNSTEMFMLTDLDYKPLGAENSTSMISQDTTFRNKFTYALEGLEPGVEYVVQAKGVDKTGYDEDKSENEFVATERFKTGTDTVDQEVTKEQVTSQGVKSNISTGKLEGEMYSHGIDWIRKDAERAIQITNFDMMLREIKIQSREDIRNIKLEAITSDKTPEWLENPVPSDGQVFEYIQIIAENAPDEKIKTAKIVFEVSNIWLKNNNIPVDGVALFRLSSGEWQQLPTSLIEERALNSKYEALSPGFSLFAIASKNGVKEKTGTEQSVEVQSMQAQEAEPEVNKEPVEEDSSSESFSVPWPWVVGVLIVLLSGIFLHRMASLVKQRAETVDKVDHHQLKVNMKKLESFVEEALSKGHGKDTIRKKLVESGWDSRLVDFVLRRK